MIYEKVTRLCEEKGISVAKLEQELGFGNGTVRRWNENSPTVSKIKAVAQYFGKTIDELTE